MDAFKSATDLVSKSLKMFGVGLGMYEIKAFIASGIEASDVQIRLAARLGMTQRELATLEYAAHMADMTAETLTTNLGRFNQILGETIVTGAGASKAYAALGTSAEELSNLDSVQQQKKISEGLEKVENTTLKAAYAQDIYGKGYRDMLDVMKLGPTIFSEAAKEVDKLGLALSDRQIEQIDSYTEKVKKLELAWKGFKAQSSSEASKMGTDVLGFFGEAYKQYDYYTNKIGWKTEDSQYAPKKEQQYDPEIELRKRLLQQQRAKEIESVARNNLIDKDNKSIDNIIGKLKEQSAYENQSNNQKELSRLKQLVADKEKLVLSDKELATDKEKLASIEKELKADKEKLVQAEKYIETIKGLEAAKKKSTEETERQKKAEEEITKNLEQRQGILKNLIKKEEDIGLTDSQKEIAELKAAGASPGTIAIAESVQKQIDLEERAKKVRDGIKSAAEKDPQTKYNEHNKEFNALLEAGVLTWDEYSKAVKAAKDELEKTHKKIKDVKEEQKNQYTEAKVFDARYIDVRGFAYGVSKTNTTPSTPSTPSTGLGSESGSITGGRIAMPKPKLNKQGNIDYAGLGKKGSISGVTVAGGEDEKALLGRMANSLDKIESMTGRLS